ncbi:hypothetical protein AYO49_01115 [Verrucomicrobiaceae bacterium SCGC AG-212-N21]|nr:hypothetical protein AYO49_01115 [Verrucomicrobiaceae bacterium SCGC AG-212-N21]
MDSQDIAKSRARGPMVGLFAWIVLLTLVFLQPLVSLFAYASDTALHSHIVLVPWVVAWLIHLRRPVLPNPGSSSLWAAMLPLAAGAASLTLAFSLGSAPTGRLSQNDYLALMSLSYVCFLWAGGFSFLGIKGMSAIAFPAAFLVFLVPMPSGMTEWLEQASVFGSAEAADWMFRLSGTPFVRDGVSFQLPGIAIRVAQECSGIRSSWVLFITSLVASHLFLKRPWRQVILVAVVFPLAILRNGFRILVIGLLCVNVGPHMIDSVIHHRGGPLFFGLSLIPLFLLLVWLRRGEAAASRTPASLKHREKV